MKFLCSLFALQIVASLCFAQVKVDGLLCENRTNPLGMDVSTPRFSWKLVSDKRNEMQSAYRVEVSEKSNFSGQVWDSGKVKSDSSVFVTYKGQPLQSGKKYFWRVQIWDNAGKSSGWSTPAWWQTALFHESDWKAQWITPGYQEDTVMRPCPLMRKQFAANKKIRSAVAYITAHGMYEANINGNSGGSSVRSGESPG